MQRRRGVYPERCRIPPWGGSPLKSIELSRARAAQCAAREGARGAMRALRPVLMFHGRSLEQEGGNLMQSASPGLFHAGLRLAVFFVLLVVALAFFTDGSTYCPWLVFAVFLVCLVRSIYLLSLGRAVFTVAWDASLHSITAHGIPPDWEFVALAYALVSAIVVLAVVFWKGGSRQA